MKVDTADMLANLSPVEFFQFASFIPGRTNGCGARNQDYKRHKTLAHAKSAIANLHGAYGYGLEVQAVIAASKIYQWVGTFDAGSWELVKEES